jgi:hypothetical protein
MQINEWQVKDQQLELGKGWMARKIGMSVVRGSFFPLGQD